MKRCAFCYDTGKFRGDFDTAVPVLSANRSSTGRAVPRRISREPAGFYAGTGEKRENQGEKLYFCYVYAGKQFVGFKKSCKNRAD